MRAPDVGAFVSTGGGVLIALLLCAVIFGVCIVRAKDLQATQDQRFWADLEDVDWDWPTEWRHR